jgi:excisionase family DNA binding protein
MTALARPATIDPTEVEHDDLESLAGMLDASERGAATLRGPNGEAVILPASAFDALRLVVRWMAEGRTINLVPSGSSISTQQAADMLGVSRPHVVRLLDKGEMSFDKPGVHRRIPVEEVIAYRERRRTERRAGLQRIGEISGRAKDAS